MIEIKCNKEEQNILIILLAKNEVFCPVTSPGKCSVYLKDCKACVRNEIKWTITE